VLTLQADEAHATALVAAIQDGNVTALRQYLAAEPALATARIVDGLGVSRTLLHVVADWPGHVPGGAQTVLVLAAAGADLNAPVLHTREDGAPETALHWAASSNDVSVLDALLDAGADIEAAGAVFTGGAPMSDAVVFAQWRAARRLLERGAATTIWQAAALGLLARVQACCETGPPHNSTTLTNALWHACRGGQRSTAEYLLDRGADLNWIGYDHRTPTDAARESGDASLLQWLRARGGRSFAELP